MLFVTVFWLESPKLDALCKGVGGWDMHGSNFHCLRQHLLPEFDQCFAALLADLHERGLLEQTLVLVNSEMGRKPKVGDPRSGGPKGTGRDHWTQCMTAVLAGDGVCGGQVYGASDKIAVYPADRAVSRRTSPRRSITSWAWTTWKPSTAKVGRSTSCPRDGR